MKADCIELGPKCGYPHNDLVPGYQKIRRNIAFVIPNEEWFNQEFTINELERSLNSFRRHKSPGPDKIPLLFLKKLKKEDKSQLL